MGLNVRVSSVGRLLFFVMLLGLVESQNELYASTDQSSLQSLIGLQGVGLAVEMNLDPEAKNDGLSKDQIQKTIESRLLQMGVKVITKRENLITLGSPYLNINILTSKRRPSETYSFCIDVKLTQTVVLDRDHKIVVPGATTWDKQGVGSVGSTNLGSIKVAALELVDQFINDYRIANSQN